MKALIAMSGGVDSSVAAKLMKNKGYECIGCTMKLHDSVSEALSLPDGTKTCCSVDDVADARAVAARLDMPYYVFNFREEFEEKIIKKFVESYSHGRTPNPCIDCNRYMKFNRLFKRAEELGCDCVVTGHYVRVTEDENGVYHLLKAVDASKDQSYVLYSLTQEQLKHARFPLGELTKTETRELAEKWGFVNADKPDSQDICFVPDGDYAAVIKKYAGRDVDRPGKFVDTAGNVMGDHKGITHYTIGQRKGLGLALKAPAYVKKLDVDNNQVVLCSDAELFERELTASDVNWISGTAPSESVRLSAKIRYRHKEQPCTVYPTGADTIRVIFDEPQRAITPGQSVVMYDGDEVIGGGTID